MKIWKISFSRDSEAKDTADNLDYCITHNIVAVLRVDKVKLWHDLEVFKDFQDYPSEIYAMFDQVRESDLVWTRDHHGRYHLGRILDYKPMTQAEKTNIPDRLQAECWWYQMGKHSTISKVIVDAFEPYRKFRVISDIDASLYSRLVFNGLLGSYRYPISDISIQNLFNLFSADDCLDIVALYLQQSHGYRILPSTIVKRKGMYTFDISMGLNGETGLVIVSTEEKKVDIDKFSSYSSPVYIFAPGINIDGLIPEVVEVILLDELQEFMSSNLLPFPLKIGKWVRIFLNHTVRES